MNMKIYDETKDISLNNTAVTLGKFNAFHLGHRKLIEYIKNEKNEKGYKTTIFSFDTATVFNQPLIVTKEERIEICRELDIDNLIFYPVNNETMSMEPERFIKDILIGKFDSKVVVTGKDFCFGKNRSGNVNLLKEYSEKYGYKLIIVDSVCCEGQKVSSTKIKEYLSAGMISEANKMLGYNYFIMGEIVRGKQLGRTIDKRTINIIPEEDKLVPGKGVYKTNVYLDGRLYKGITNVGINPTVDSDGKTKVETHILDFNEEIYGKTVKIEFIKFIREEKKFSDLEALKRQISLDILEAKN